MKHQLWMKQTSMIVLALSLILFSLLTSVSIQPQTIEAKGNSNPSNELVESEKDVITLITGDIVTVTEDETGGDIINVESNDPDSVTRVTTTGEDTYVIPEEAMPYITSNALDQELFNITVLMDYGYDDLSRDDLPVIVQYPEDTKAHTLTETFNLSDADNMRVLESIQSVAVAEEKDNVENLWDDLTKDNQNAKSEEKDDKGTFANGIEKVWLDGKVELNLADSVPQVHAPEAWESGYNGEDTTVAVLDSGIDNEHPDIVDQLEIMESFVPDSEGLDGHGHGTHVASTVLGTGDASDGMYKGVAPGADLLVGKVLDDTGTGQDSWVISGMEWAADEADIINMSLGGTQPSDGTDPMSQAINTLTEETGSLFVVAAGNAGQEESISSPSAADAALTVGNVDKSDNLSPTSSMGPRVGDMAIKPDLAAPGEEIIAARSQYAEGTGVYMGMSGTSMASPHVAGAAAIVKQKHPDWTAPQIKNALMSTTEDLEDALPFQVGTGRLDVASAVESNIHATGSISFGFFKWPYDESEPVEKAITYYNDSDEDVTLDLIPTFTQDDDGSSATDMSELSESTITIPAKDEKEVTITLDPEHAAMGTRYWGELRAELDEETIVHTAMGMVKEDEKYPLTLRATDRDGSPGTASVQLMGSDFNNPQLIEVDGETEVRLPKGDYSAMSLMEVSEGTADEGYAFVGDPDIQLDESMTVELDASTANEVNLETPEKTEPSYQRLDYYRSYGEHADVNTLYLLPKYANNIYAMPTEKVETGEFEMLSRWRMVKPVQTVRMDEEEIDVTSLQGMTPLNGEHHLDTVFAGDGTPEDYEKIDAKGKAVLINLNNNISAVEQANTALDEGAELLIIANDNPSTFFDYVGNEDGSAISLAVVSINETSGDMLAGEIAQGNVVLDIEGTPHTPYLYDLVDVHTDAIPEDLTYAPEEEDLAKVTSQYTSSDKKDGSEFRYDRRPYSMSSVGEQMPITLPTVRDEWVSVTDGTEWYQEARTFEDGEPDDAWKVAGTQKTHEPGERLEEEWFSPVIQPKFGSDGLITPFRDIAGGFQLNVPSYADSGLGHVGLVTDPIKQQAQNLVAYQDDKLLGETDGQMLITWDQLPDEELSYRLVSDVNPDTEKGGTSSQTHTEWSFLSEGVKDDNVDLPLLSLNYQADVNTSGHIIADTDVELTLDVTEIDGVDGYGDIENISLSVSYDKGDTWEETSLKEKGNSWVTTIHPSEDATSVSLKANASDDEENAISQEINDAYTVIESGAADLNTLVKQLSDDGSINEEASRKLQMHATTIKLFEEKGATDKVLKHVNGLYLLLEQQEKSGKITDRAYNLLEKNATFLETAWER